MATKEEKIQKIEEDLKIMKETLITYGNIFREDGQIDSDEQRELDKMQITIKKIEAKLVDMNGGEDNSERKKMNKELMNLKDELETVLLVYGLR